MRNPLPTFPPIVYQYPIPSDCIPNCNPPIDRHHIHVPDSAHCGCEAGCGHKSQKNCFDFATPFYKVHKMVSISFILLFDVIQLQCPPPQPQPKAAWARKGSCCWGTTPVSAWKVVGHTGVQRKFLNNPTVA